MALVPIGGSNFLADFLECTVVAFIKVAIDCDIMKRIDKLGVLLAIFGLAISSCRYYCDYGFRKRILDAMCERFELKRDSLEVKKVVGGGGTFAILQYNSRDLGVRFEKIDCNCEMAVQLRERADRLIQKCRVSIFMKDGITREEKIWSSKVFAVEGDECWYLFFMHRF